MKKSYNRLEAQELSQMCCRASLSSSKLWSLPSSKLGSLPSSTDFLRCKSRSREVETQGKPPNILIWCPSLQHLSGICFKSTDNVQIWSCLAIKGLVIMMESLAGASLLALHHRCFREAICQTAFSVVRSTLCKLPHFSPLPSPAPVSIIHGPFLHIFHGAEREIKDIVPISWWIEYPNCWHNTAASFSPFYWHTLELIHNLYSLCLDCLIDISERVKTTKPSTQHIYSLYWAH